MDNEENNDVLHYDDLTDLIDNLKRKLLNENFVKQIIILKPYFGLKIISDGKIDSFFKNSFSNLYFSNLLLEKNSIFYQEIADTQNYDFSKHKYKINKKNKILRTLFSIEDINGNKTLLADQIGVYKPIGDMVIKILKEQKKKEKDVYNEYNEKFIVIGDSMEPFNDPVFVGIRFFDIMLREALYQKIEWHMWLYYYFHFVKQICENYSVEYIDKSVSHVEFPNVYSYFLYEIISNLKKWIELIIKDTKNVKQQLKCLDCSHENENIIKSSIICLKLCIEEILDNGQIQDDEKEFLTKKLLNLYLELAGSEKEEANQYGKVMLCCMLDMSMNHKKYLLQFLENFDRPKLLGRPHTQNCPEIFNNLKKELTDN